MYQGFYFLDFCLRIVNFRALDRNISPMSSVLQEQSLIELIPSQKSRRHAKNDLATLQRILI